MLTIGRAHGLTLRGVDASLSESRSHGVADGATYAGEAPPPHILVVGHEALLSEYLSENRYRVTDVPDEAAMLEAVQSTVVDVVVLAFSPQHDQGAQLVQRLRTESPVPIIVLSARREEFDRIMALELGADDCLTAPFSPRELLARVRAILRRRRAGPDHRPVLRFGRLEIDREARQVRLDGRERPLTSHQFDLLAALADRAGRVLSREALMERVRGDALEAFDRSIDVHISRIRAAIEDDPRHPRRILTVRGAGYVFARAQDED